MSEEQKEKKRLPYYEEATIRGKDFAEKLIEDVPELEAVAVVYSYAVNASDVPFAMVMGQSGPLRSPVEVMHMSNQMWRALAYQMDNAQQIIRSSDNYMKEQGQKLAKIQKELEAAEKRLREIKQSPGFQEEAPGE